MTLLVVRGPGGGGSVFPPRAGRDGYDVGRQHRLDVLDNRQEPCPQAAVRVVFVDLVARALLQGGQDVVDVAYRAVGNPVQGCGGEVDEVQKPLRGQELNHLAELKRVTCRAGAVAQLALPVTGSIQPYEMPRDGSNAVEEAFAARLQLSLKAVNDGANERRR